MCSHLGSGSLCIHTLGVVPKCVPILVVILKCGPHLGSSS